MPSNREKGDFASHIRRLREQRGLTKGQLAKYAGISPSTVSMWESGRRRQPDASALDKVAPVLGLKTEDLLKLAGLMSESPPELLAETHAIYYVDGEPISQDEHDIAIEAIRAYKRVKVREDLGD